MRKISAAVVAALLCGAFGGGAVAKAPTKRSFTISMTGAQISPGVTVFKVTGTVTGAAVQTTKLSEDGKSGTGTDKTYDGRGVMVTRFMFTLSAPDADGIVTVKGKGRFTKGTRLYKGVTGRYTFTGTVDLKTTLTKATVKGTFTY